MLKCYVKYQVILTYNVNSASIRYFRYGIIHRDDGPAVVWPNGRISWWQYGHRHRKDAPALYQIGGKKEYWIRGNYVEISSNF